MTAIKKIKSNSLNALNEVLKYVTTNDSGKIIQSPLLEADDSFSSVIQTDKAFNPSKINSNVLIDDNDGLDTKQLEKKNKLKSLVLTKIKQSLEISDDLQAILREIDNINNDVNLNNWELNEEDNTATLKSRNASIFLQNNSICLSHNGEIEIFENVDELHNWLKKNNYPLPRDIKLKENVNTSNNLKEYVEKDNLSMLDFHNALLKLRKSSPKPDSKWGNPEALSGNDPTLVVPTDDEFKNNFILTQTKTDENGEIIQQATSEEEYKADFGSNSSTTGYKGKPRSDAPTTARFAKQSTQDQITKNNIIPDFEFDTKKTTNIFDKQLKKALKNLENTDMFNSENLDNDYLEEDVLSEAGNITAIDYSAPNNIRKYGSIVTDANGDVSVTTKGKSQKYTEVGRDLMNSIKDIINKVKAGTATEGQKKFLNQLIEAGCLNITPPKDGQEYGSLMYEIYKKGKTTYTNDYLNKYVSFANPKTSKNDFVNYTNQYMLPGEKEIKIDDDIKANINFKASIYNSMLNAAEEDMVNVLTKDEAVARMNKLNEIIKNKLGIDYDLNNKYFYALPYGIINKIKACQDAKESKKYIFGWLRGWLAIDGNENILDEDNLEEVTDGNFEVYSNLVTPDKKLTKEDLQKEYPNTEIHIFDKETQELYQKFTKGYLEYLCEHLYNFSTIKRDIVDFYKTAQSFIMSSDDQSTTSNGSQQNDNYNVDDQFNNFILQLQNILSNPYKFSEYQETLKKAIKRQKAENNVNRLNRIKQMIDDLQRNGIKFDPEVLELLKNQNESNENLYNNFNLELLKKDLDTHFKTLTEDESPEDFAVDTSDETSGTGVELDFSADNIEQQSDNSEMDFASDNNSTEDTNPFGGSGMSFGGGMDNYSPDDMDTSMDDIMPTPEEDEYKILNILENDSGDIKVEVQNLSSGKVEEKDLSEIDI